MILKRNALFLSTESLEYYVKMLGFYSIIIQNWGQQTTYIVFYEVFKENQWFQISWKMSDPANIFFPFLSSDQIRLQNIIKKNNKCSLNQENETEVVLNVWRNLGYKANEIGLTGNTDKEHGSSEHWGNCGDSKGKSWESASWCRNRKVMSGPWCNY